MDTTTQGTSKHTFSQRLGLWLLYGFLALGVVACGSSSDDGSEADGGGVSTLPPTPAPDPVPDPDPDPVPDPDPDPDPKPDPTPLPDPIPEPDPIPDPDPMPDPDPVPDPDPIPDPDPVPAPNPIPPAVGETITSLNIVSTGSSTQSNVPVTFGQVFVKGHVPAGSSVVGRIEGGSGVVLQVDNKATYDDGSLKHGVFSALMPSLPAGATQTLELVLANNGDDNGTPLTMSALGANYQANISINVGGQTYTASATNEIANSTPTYWLQGPVVTEAHYKTPLRTAGGNAHPHLTARYHIRVYPNGMNRTDAIVENTTTFVENIGSSISHTTTITSGNGTELSENLQGNKAHRHHSRFKDTFWQGASPQVRLVPDMEYLLATKAVSNIDRSVVIPEGRINGFDNSWETGTGNRSGLPRKDIMGAGLSMEYMPTTGGRPDLGPLNGWEASYINSLDPRLEKVMYGTADASAHWPIHYRDESTDLPVSLTTYRDFSIHPNVCSAAVNPLPSSSCELSSDLTPDTAHQPSLNYIPYLLTGDYYQLEELHFWVNWNSFHTAASLRGFELGWYTHQQYRAQAWSMRKLGRAVFITPDEHPMKSYFNTRLTNNINHYMEIATGPDAPALHNLPAYGSREDFNTLSPWQADFFVVTINDIIHLGFTAAEPLYDWLIEYPLMRANDDVYCWQFATVYHHWVRAPNTSNYIDNMADTYILTLQNRFPSSWQAISQAECGSEAMANAAGFASAGDFASYRSYLAYYRSALAGAVERNLSGAQTAWNRIDSADRQPIYYEYPQFSILPRTN